MLLYTVLHGLLPMPHLAEVGAVTTDILARLFDMDGHTVVLRGARRESWNATLKGRCLLSAVR